LLSPPSSFLSISVRRATTYKKLARDSLGSKPVYSEATFISSEIFSSLASLSSFDGYWALI
jgi:hypothetical protein